MNHVWIVSATELNMTEKLSYSFMFTPGVPTRELMAYSHYYGLVTLRNKDDNFINPFKLAQREPNAVGDDGIARWNINIIESGRGIILGIGVDEGGEEQIVNEFRKIPYCVLLTHSEALEKLIKICEQAGAQVYFHEHQSVLSTS